QREAGSGGFRLPVAHLEIVGARLARGYAEAFLFFLTSLDLGTLRSGRGTLGRSAILGHPSSKGLTELLELLLLGGLRLLFLELCLLSVDDLLVEGLYGGRVLAILPGPITPLAHQIILPGFQRLPRGP